MATTLRIACVNLHMGVPEGLELHPEHERIEALHDVAAFLLDQRVDLALLQEVRDDVPGARPGGVPHQLAVLAGAVAASDTAYHATVATGAGDAYGIALLALGGHHFEDVHVEQLPHSADREPRCAIFCHVCVRTDDGAEPAGCITVANTHLDFGRDREAQLHALAGCALEHASRGPVVVGGDFNERWDAMAEAMARTRLTNIVDGLHDDDPRRRDTHVLGGRIDHLLVSEDVVVVEHDLHEVPAIEVREGTGVTDHLAIVAELRVAVGARVARATPASV